MFEILTKTEAQVLRDMLVDGYESSRRYSRTLAARERLTTDQGRIREWAKLAYAQASMRSESTGICSQIRREVLGYE